MSRDPSTEADDRALARGVVDALAAITTVEMRRHAFLRRLSGLEAPEAAALLNGVVQLAVDRHRAAAALVPLVGDLRGLAEALGQARMAAVVDAARRTGRADLLRLLTSRTARRAYDGAPETGSTSGPASLPLGWRTQLGRTGSRDTLDRLLYDQQPTVIENLLRNPRCTEREVVRIAAHRPTSAGVLAVVFRHPKWIQRYQVKRALALNPYAAPSQSIGLLPSLLTQDLELIARDETLHHDVASAAAALLAARGIGAPPPREPAPPPVPPSPDDEAGETPYDEEDGGTIEASPELKAALEAALRDIEAVEALADAAGEAAAKGGPTRSRD
ncbi:MAG TPA: hypothetical protein VF406_17355 [Thermodesulfobacteriota bacterium]